MRYFGGRDWACEETTSGASAAARARRRALCDRYAVPETTTRTISVRQDLGLLLPEIRHTPPGWIDQNKTLVWGGAIGLAALLVVGLGTALLWPKVPAGGGSKAAAQRPPVRPTRAVSSPAVMVGRSGQFRGVSIPVPLGGLVLGRDPPGEGRLAFAEDSDVSRRHCSIIYDETSRRFKVTDLGSRNGTFMIPDEKKLVANQEVLCRPGQIIRLGRDHAFELTVK